MKNILITGANSYIGMSFEKYLQQWPDEYQIATVDMIDESWRKIDFHRYDTIFHVSGIAHQKETRENANVYYAVNCDLAIETAKIAKLAGVQQFIFMSSMSVYGMDTGIITSETRPLPKTNYGKSKCKAEQALQELEDQSFRIVILRPPMIYGKGCKGNFQTLQQFAKKYPIFPLVYNKRSLIYINNLCCYIKQLIDHKGHGLFFPQNQEYMNTSQMVKWLGEAMGKKIILSRLLGLGVMCLYPFSRTVRKAFGTLIYKEFDHKYFVENLTDIETSIKNSV